MARTKRAATQRTRNNRAQIISDSEDEKIEETQTEVIPDDNKSDSSTDSEEKTRRKRLEIAKGKKPMVIEGKKRKKEIEYDKMMFALGMGSTKGVIIGEPKKPETVTETVPKTETKPFVRPKITIKRSRSRRAFAVRSSYSLRSGLKGIGLDVDVNVSTEFDQKKVDRKRKEQEKITDDLETNLEEVCKRIKREKDHNDDENDGNGDGGLAHKNLTSVGPPIVVGN